MGAFDHLSNCFHGSPGFLKLLLASLVYDLPRKLENPIDHI